MQTHHRCTFEYIYSDVADVKEEQRQYNHGSDYVDLVEPRVSSAAEASDGRNPNDTKDGHADKGD